MGASNKEKLMKGVVFKQGFKGKAEFRFIVMAGKRMYEEHFK